MCKIKYNKAYNAVRYGEKLPRKVKKALLGKRMSKCKLNRLLKSVNIIKSCKTMYEFPIIEPYAFCPNCGCTEMIGTGNMTAYPEHWEDFHCIRCRCVVAKIDNSPFIHILEHYNDGDSWLW